MTGEELPAAGAASTPSRRRPQATELVEPRHRRRRRLRRCAAPRDEPGTLPLTGDDDSCGRSATRRRLGGVRSVRGWPSWAVIVLALASPSPVPPSTGSPPACSPGVCGSASTWASCCAALLVRRGSIFTAMVQPPLVLVVGIVVGGMLFTDVGGLYGDGSADHRHVPDDGDRDRGRRSHRPDPDPGAAAEDRRRIRRPAIAEHARPSGSAAAVTHRPAGRRTSDVRSAGRSRSLRSSLGSENVRVSVAAVNSSAVGYPRSVR